MFQRFSSRAGSVDEEMRLVVSWLTRFLHLKWFFFHLVKFRTAVLFWSFVFFLNLQIRNSKKALTLWFCSQLCGWWLRLELWVEKICVTVVWNLGFVLEFFFAISKIGITFSLRNGGVWFYHLKVFLFIENLQWYSFHCGHALFCWPQGCTLWSS